MKKNLQKNKRRKINKDDDLALATKMGLLSLAVLASTAELGFSVIYNMFLGASVRSPARAVGKISRGDIAGFELPSYYYEILKDATRNNLYVTINRLKRKGLLVEDKKGNITASKKGELLIRESYRIKDLKDEWDGKWRLISFDIPEKKKYLREWLRHVLTNSGFKAFHKSVFVSKYPLSTRRYKEIKKLGLDKYIRMMTVGEIDDQKVLFDSS